MTVSHEREVSSRASRIESREADGELRQKVNNRRDERDESDESDESPPRTTCL